MRSRCCQVQQTPPAGTSTVSISEILTSFLWTWLWFSFNSETFLENGSKKRRRQSGRWFSWAWRAWLDSIAVPVFAVWLNLTNTETASTTPLNLLQNLWSASAQWKVLESTIFGRPVDLVLQTLGRNREQVTSFKSHYLCLFLEQFIWRGCGSLGDGKTSQCSWMYPSVKKFLCSCPCYGPDQ